MDHSDWLRDRLMELREDALDRRLARLRGSDRMSRDAMRAARAALAARYEREREHNARRTRLGEGGRRGNGEMGVVCRFIAHPEEGYRDPAPEGPAAVPQGHRASMYRLSPGRTTRRATLDATRRSPMPTMPASACLFL